MQQELSKLEWVTAIREEEALASVNHSVAEIDRWEAAHFREDELRGKVKAAKSEYEDELRHEIFGIQARQVSRDADSGATKRRNGASAQFMPDGGVDERTCQNLSNRRAFSMVILVN
jgi:hypothetical protein